jgi:hypothetical protein
MVEVAASLAQRIRGDVALTLRKLAEVVEHTPEARVADVLAQLRVDDLRRALVVLKELRQD